MNENDIAKKVLEISEPYKKDLISKDAKKVDAAIKSLSLKIWQLICAENRAGQKEKIEENANKQLEELEKERARIKKDNDEIRSMQRKLLTN